MRLALEGYGEWFLQEFKLGPFYYDFAFPKLRLLLEVDSYSYHHTKRQKIRDARKTSFASDAGWELVRIQVGPKLGKRACAAVRNRRLQLLVAAFDGDEQMARMRYEDRYGASGN